MTMAVTSNTNNKDRTKQPMQWHRHTAPSDNNGDEKEKTGGKSNQHKGRSGTRLIHSQLCATHYTKCTSVWKTRESNTSTKMQAQITTYANKRVGDSPQREKKKGKNDGKGTTENGALFEDKTIVTTEVNEKYFNMVNLMKEIGTREAIIKEATTPFTAAGGPGGAAEGLVKVAKMVAKTVRYKNKDLTASQETEITKTGVSAEEWLLFSTSIVHKDTSEHYGIQQILTDEEIQTARVFLSRVSYTPPNVMCGKIQFSKTRATTYSTCWYGAKTALGSWYHSKAKAKKKTMNIQESLRRAKATEQVREIESPPKAAPPPPIEKTTTETTETTQTPKVSPPSTKKKEASKSKSVIELSDDEESDSEDSTSSEDSSSSDDSEREKKKRRKQKKKQKKAKKNKKKSSKKTQKKEHSDSDETESENEMDDTDQTNEDTMQTEDTEETESSKKKQITAKSTEVADVTAERRKHQVRLQLALAIKKGKKNKTANQMAHKLLLQLFQAIKDEDEKAILVPWLKKDSATIPAILHPKSFPETFFELKAYVERCRPKKESTCWVKVKVATNLEPVCLTSQTGGSLTSWYDEYESKGFLCGIQESDKVETIGAFLYSGPFIDHHRLTKVIHDELTGKYPTKKWLVGCRVKKMKEIDEPATSTSYMMADNQLVHLEADASQAKVIHQYVYRRFNHMDNNPGRPGGNLLRYIPAQTYVTTGPEGERDRRGMLKKHQAVLKSLTLLSSDDIKHLDKPAKDSETQNDVTLRVFLSQLTYPLTPKENQKTSPLFHSMDWAVTGIDSGAKVLFTAYHDRAVTAAKLLGILPAFIKWAVGEEAVQTWIHHQLIEMQVEFQMDDEGNWTGQWTTEGDKVQKNLLDEELGYKIEFENMDMIEGRGKRMLHADDASARTFNVSKEDEGQVTQLPDDADDARSVNAAASVASGGGGESG